MAGRVSEERYRRRWTWDKVVKVTHIRANCISACSFDAYVRDGVVVWEEPNCSYAQTCPDVPDFNPRGCPMGCVYSRTMYGPFRVKSPLKRVGPRGSGQFQPISWDQALTEIADKIIDVILEDGPECIVYDHGTTNVDFGIGSMMESHLFTVGLGATSIDSWAGVGDLPTGLIQTWGTFLSEGTADDWFYADFIVIWVGNPNYARVPDAHFIYEARYKGATVVTIAPDYSPSAIHADYYVPVRFATDAALALSLCHVIVEEGLYNEDFIKEQTDLPLLVRTDTRRFLRQCDLQEGGKEDIFYMWDIHRQAPVEAPGSWGHPVYSLKLGDISPALAGQYEVTLKDGTKAKVRPLFSLFQEHLKAYAPERAAAITGVGPQAIRELAREMAKARSLMVYMSWGACKHYHSDLFQRSVCYLLALTGNTGGKPGAGMKVSTWWPVPATVLTRGGAAEATVALQAAPPTDEIPDDMRVPVRDLWQFLTAGSRSNPITPLIPFLYVHDPRWREVASRRQYNDPSLPRDVRQYVEEAIEKGWQPVWPRPPKRPRFFYFSGPNPLRRWPLNHIIRESLWQQVDTIVCCDFRLSSSALWADYVLPAAGWYEKPGIKYTQSYIPYVVVGDQAVEPLYDSKPEWDIVMLLAKKIQEQARKRGVSVFQDAWGRQRNLATLYDDLTAQGTYREGPEGQVKALDYILRFSPLTRASGLGEDAWGEAAQRGMVRIKKVPPVAIASFLGSMFSDFTDQRPINQFEWFIKHKEPWPTLTGRQQFYIDHPWFLEAGEAFACHKEPLPAGGPFPLRISGGHDRWSIHAIFAPDETLMRLQRGEPVVYLSIQDAQRRGIADHDRVRVYNEVGEFVARAKVSPCVQPGQVIIYHSREPYQFPRWLNQNTVTATPIKVTNMVGDYGHLQYRMAYYSPNHIPKEAAVEVEKV
jgi:DMSO reductase family type II enzyme molybdopterin subunit